MSGSQHDVNLNIRASYQDNQSIASVTAQVKALTDALVRQSGASNTDSLAYSQLNRTMQEAARAAQQLTQARSAVAAIEERLSVLAATNTKLEAARATRDQAAAALPIDPTKSQVTAFEKTETAVRRLEARIAGPLTASYERAAAAAQRIGIDPTRANEALREITTATMNLANATALASNAESQANSKRRQYSEQVQLYTQLFREQEKAEAEAAATARKAAADRVADEQRVAEAIEKRIALESEEVAKVRAGSARATASQQRADQTSMYAGLFDQVDNREAEARQQALAREQMDKYRGMAQDAAAKSREAALAATAPLPSRPAAGAQDRVSAALGQNTVETTQQLTDRVGKLNTALADGGQTAKQYATNIRAVRDANDDLIRQAGVFDRFQKSNQQIARLSQQLVEGENRVTDLRTRASGASTPEQAEEAARATVDQGRANQGISRQLEQARQAIVPLREELARLGVAESAVETAIRNLESAARQSVTAMDAAANQQIINAKKLAAGAGERASAAYDQATAPGPSAATAGAVVGGSVNAALGGLAGGKGEITDTAAAIEQLDAVLAKGKISVHDYDDFMAKLYATAKRVASDASLVDRFQLQNQAVQSAELELSKMVVQVQATAQAIQRAVSPSEELNATLLREEAEVTRLATALQRERTALDVTSTALQRNNIDASNATAATARLTAQAEKLATLQKSSSSATNEFLGLSPYKLKILEDNIGQAITQLSLGQGVVRTFESQANQIFELFNVSLGALKSFVIYSLPIIPILVTLYQGFQRFRENTETLRQFNAMLIGSADGARTSAGELLEATHRIKELGASFDEARGAVAEFFRAGIRSDLLVSFGKATQDLVDAYGVKFPDAVKEVTKAFTGNYDSVRELDRQYNFLSVSQADHIRALFDEGKGQEALSYAFDIFKSKNDQAAAANRTVWQVEVRNLKAAWSEFIEAVSDVVPFEGLINTLNHITVLVENLRRLGRGDISTQQANENINNDLDGGAKLTPDQKQLQTAEKRRRDIQAELKSGDANAPVISPDGTMVYDNAGSMSPEKTEALKAELTRVEQRIAELKASIGSAGLQGSLDALEKRRDELIQAGSNPQARTPRSGGDAGANAPEGYAAMRDRAAIQAGLDPEYFGRLQRSESKFNSLGMAEDSPTGAKGPLQLIQSTFDMVKQAHSDITGGIRDLQSNTQAGAYYAADQLRKKGNDAYSGVLGYHGADPNNPSQVADANAQARKVAANYTGSPLLPDNLPEVNQQIAATRARLNVGPDPGPTQRPTNTTDNTVDMKKAANDFADTIEKRIEELRIRTERGNTPENIKQDEDRINRQVLEEQREMQRALPGYEKGRDPRIDDDLAKYRARLEDQAKERRDAQQKEIDDKKASEEQKLVTELASLRESFDKRDKTDPVAARRAVEEARQVALAPIQTARRNGVTSAGGISIDDLEKQVNQQFDERSTDAGIKADEAIVTKTLAERKSAYDKLNADLKAGVITIMQAFQQAADIAAKFNPRIKEAVDNAKHDLAGQKQTPEVTSEVAKLDATPMGGGVEDNKLVEEGIAKLKELQAAREDVAKQQKELLANGATSAEAAEAAIQAAFNKTGQTSRDLIDSLRQQIEAMRSVGEIGPEQYEKLIAQLKLAQVETQHVSDFQKELDKTIEGAFTGGALKAVDDIGASLGRLATGQEKFKNVIEDTGVAFAHFAADFIKSIGEMILKTYLLAAAKSLIGADGGGGSAGIGSLISGAASLAGGAGGGSSDAGGFDENATQGGGSSAASTGTSAVSTIGSLVSLVALLHGGGRVGPTSNMRRAVDPAVFLNAPRMHGGGTVGLASNERPAILEDGEQVISKSDMRAAASNGANPPPAVTRNVLAVGDQEIANAMAGSHGEKVVLNHLKRNTTTVRQVAGS